MISEYSSIIKSQDYMDELKAMAERIRKVAFSTPNEATIETRFDNELFSFFRKYFEPLGFEYNPIKDKAIAEHVARRPDTAIASLVIEFKQPSTLQTEYYKDKAFIQISNYLEEIGKKNESKVLEG